MQDRDRSEVDYARCKIVIYTFVIFVDCPVYNRYHQWFDVIPLASRRPKNGKGYKTSLKYDMHINASEMKLNSKKW